MTAKNLAEWVRRLETAVWLYLQGLLLTEISRRMDHHPSRVQRYIDDFQRVAELLDQGVVQGRIVFITGLPAQRGQATYRALRAQQAGSRGIPDLRNIGRNRTPGRTGTRDRSGGMPTSGSDEVPT